MTESKNGALLRTRTSQTVLPAEKYDGYSLEEKISTCAVPVKGNACKLYSSEEDGGKYVIDSLDTLISKIHEILGEDTGLGDDPEKVEKVKQAMTAYDSGVYDWVKHSHYSGGRYTRNLIDKGNSKFNFLLLVWSPETSSPIHDHANSQCVFKMLEGTLCEERFIHSTPISNHDPKPLEMISNTTVTTNDVGHINDSMGYHRMVNPSSEFAMSLHLYSPPFDFCKVINEASGEKTVSQCNVFFDNKHTLTQESNVGQETNADHTDITR
ncbi:hypothetical protein BB560_003869 [Smittium megazygosporum]|uniref:Cysteine dioxygenase n=1 Tax=Smittium megazygosporum TaxID=133381 RepID=A0A2T9ZAT9_9FUNG|nr:hypothetical protein BB560_003869 [Smittium megazygosporum]